MDDFVAQRKNMVESQVRPSDITDRRIIRAMAVVPRELFVPAAARSFAYRDDAIPLTEARGGKPLRTLLGARSLAAMVQMLDLGDRDRVMIVGAGSGYSTAIVARIAHTVVALESDPELAAMAIRALAACGPSPATVTPVAGALVAGHAAGAPYDAILVDGGVTTVPTALLDQLKDGGRLVAVRLDGGVGRASVWRRSGSTFASTALRDMNVAGLPGFEAKPSFVF